MQKKTCHRPFRTIFPPLDARTGQALYLQRETLRILSKVPWQRKEEAMKTLVPFEKLTQAAAERACQLAVVDAFDRRGFTFTGEAYPCYFFLKENLPVAERMHPRFWKGEPVRLLARHWKSLRQKDKERYFRLAEKYNRAML